MVESAENATQNMGKLRFLRAALEMVKIPMDMVKIKSLHIVNI
jgi:hypothetical protein